MTERNNQNNEQIGRRVRQLREDAGLSQDELAERIGYTGEARRSTISRIERGELTLPLARLLSIARVFDVPVEYLTTGERSPRIDYQTTIPEEQYREQAARLAAYIRKAGPDILSDTLTTEVTVDEIQLLKLFRASAEETKQRVIDLLLTSK